MAYSDYLAHLQLAPALPDTAQLGGRLLMCDGVNPNMIFDGHEENSRIQGAFPDASTFTLMIRVGSNSHTFRVEGPDSLNDSRYKEILKEIIRASEMHTP